MTAHRAINIALATLSAIVIAAMLSAAHLLDDNSADWQHASDLADAQRQAQREARREHAAGQLCQRLRGEAAYRWTQDGELVCVDKHGRNAVVVASGDSL